MKKCLIIILLSLVFENGFSQKNYENKRFALISTSYQDASCRECQAISNQLFSQMKGQAIFFDSKYYLSWISSWKKNDLSKFPRIDFFLTSEVVKKSNHYLLEFKLFDKEKKEYKTINFKQKLSKTEWKSELVKLSKSIVDELTDFKYKGHFKNVIMVDDFDPYMMEEDINDFIEGFTLWLTEVLKKEDLLRLNYHVYGQFEINEHPVKNKVDGKFFKKKVDNVQMKMKIHLADESKDCSTMDINIYDFESNQEEIVAEIIKILNFLEEKKQSM